MSAPEGAGEAPLRRVSARVFGRVQGVFFRASTRERALELGLQGWACNCPDGSVQVLAQGAPAAVEALLEFLRRGPELARVERLQVHDAPPRDDDLRGFGVG